MTTSPVLGLPFIASQQSTPEITHNEALVMISALLRGVKDKDLSAPPGAPADGDSYIVGAAPTGAWTGRAGSIAVYATNQWRFIPGNDSAGTAITMGTAQEGMRVFVQDENASYTWSGSAWVIGGDGAFVLKAGDSMTGALQINANTTFGFDLIRTDDGSLGPGIRSKHETTSPAISDFTGFWNIYAETDTGAEVVAGAFQCITMDPTNATYKSRMKFACSGTGGENSFIVSPDGIYTISGGTSATGQGAAAGSINAKGLYSNGQLAVDTLGLIRARQYTVATLPAAGTAGRKAAVTNALAPAYGAVVAGGGAVNIPVYDNGVAWVTV